MILVGSPCPQKAGEQNKKRENDSDKVKQSPTGIFRNLSRKRQEEVTS
jgi:hypothetical protein